MNVLIHRTLTQEAVSRFEAEFSHHDIRVIDAAEPIEPHLPWAEILLANPPADHTLKQAGQLRWVQLLSSGFDGYTSFKDASFKVTTAHGLHAFTIAQHVLMMMMILERRQPFFSKRQSERIWDRLARLPGLLKGQTLGLVGYGAIASALVNLVRPLGLVVKAVTKRPALKPPDNAVSIAGMEGLDELLSTSDHIVITLPSTPETRGLIDPSRIGAIKCGAYLHNVARGDLVETAAIVDALRSGHLGGASLDVFENEPLSADSPLWNLENCIVTPHIAGHHKNLDTDLLVFFADNLRRFDQKQPLANEADFVRGY